MNVTFRIGSNWSVFLFDARTRRVTGQVLSVQQIILLDLLKKGTVHRKKIRAAIYGSGENRTPSERASLSRSIRRLVSLGFADKAGNSVSITEAGLRFAEGVVPKWREDAKRWASSRGGRVPAWALNDDALMP